MQISLSRFFRRSLIACSLLSFIGLNALNCSAAAGLHFSQTEARYDRAQGRLLLTVRVQTSDFEAALSERANHKISAADPGSLAPLALDYIREKLLIKTAAGDSIRLDWAGIDVTDAHLFLFFEVSLPKGIEGASLANTVLIERFSDQINTVELHDGALKQTLVFARDSGQKIVHRTP